MTISPDAKPKLPRGVRLMLDALHFAYVAPGHIPPGAFVPEE